MASTALSVTDTIVVSYHLLHVLSERPPEDTGFGDNGLATPVAGGFAVVTGVHTGPVRVDFVVLDGPPGLDPRRDMHPWDDVVELSWASAREFVGIGSPTMDSPVAFQALALPGGGSYRTRVHCAGRDEAVDGEPGATPEHHRLVTWAAPTAAPVAHRLTDACGRAHRAVR